MSYIEHIYLLSTKRSDHFIFSISLNEICMQLTVVTCHSNIFRKKTDFPVWNFINFSFRFLLLLKLFPQPPHVSKYLWEEICQPNWQMKLKHISTMSLGEKWCKIVNGNKILCTRGGSEKMLNFLFLLSRHHSEAISLQNMKVLTSTWQQKKKKTVTAWIARKQHKNKYGYTVVKRSRAPLFRQLKTRASFINIWLCFFSSYQYKFSLPIQHFTLPSPLRMKWEKAKCLAQKKVAAKLAPLIT